MGASDLSALAPLDGKREAVLQEGQPQGVGMKLWVRLLQEERKKTIRVMVLCPPQPGTDPCLF